MASIYEGFQTDESSIEFIDPVTKKPTRFNLDVTVSITTSLSAAVTKFPIEGRQNITDHIQPSPLSLSLQCFISESPSQQILTLASGLAGAIVSKVVPAGLTQTFARAAASAGVSAVGAQIGKSTLDEKSASFASLLTTRSANDKDYPKRAMLGLTKMFQSGTPFTLRTFFRKDIYTDLVMTSLSFNQTAKEGESLSFTMTCEKIKTTKAFSDTTKLELKAKNPAGGSASEKDNKGKKEAKESSDPRKSLIKKGYDFTGEVAQGVTGG